MEIEALNYFFIHKELGGNCIYYCIAPNDLKLLCGVFYALNGL
jgi:hypothetical protein